MRSGTGARRRPRGVIDSRTITVGNARRHECAAALYAFSVGLGFVFADPGLRQRANQPAGNGEKDEVAQVEADRL